MQIFLGQKIGMTQVFAPDGSAVPVTLVHVPRAVVTQIKTAKTDGYAAVQVGTKIIDDEKEATRKLSRPLRGHLKASKVNARRLYEFRVTVGTAGEKATAEKAGGEAGPKVGDEIMLAGLKAGDAVQVAGTSKGHGFAGVVKRHHFAGGPASHGHKDNLRAPGAIGSGHPQHVIKGTRMAGHMGDARATLKNLEVIEVRPEDRLVVLKGSVPGAVKSWIEIKPLDRAVRQPTHARPPLAVARPGSDKGAGDMAEKSAAKPGEKKEAKPAEKPAEKKSEANTTEKKADAKPTEKKS